MSRLEGQELDGDTALAVVELLDANDLADVFVVAEIGRRVIPVDILVHLDDWLRENDVIVKWFERE